MRFSLSFAALAAAITAVTSASIDSVNNGTLEAEDGHHLERRFEMMAKLYDGYNMYTGMPHVNVWGTTLCMRMSSWNLDRKVSSWIIPDYSICRMYIDTVDCTVLPRFPYVWDARYNNVAIPEAVDNKIRSVKCRMAPGCNEWGDCAGAGSRSGSGEEGAGGAGELKLVAADADEIRETDEEGDAIEG